MLTLVSVTDEELNVSKDNEGDIVVSVSLRETGTLALDSFFTSGISVFATTGEHGILVGGVFMSNAC